MAFFFGGGGLKNTANGIIMPVINVAKLGLVMDKFSTILPAFILRFFHLRKSCVFPCGSEINFRTGEAHRAAHQLDAATKRTRACGSEIGGPMRLFWSELVRLGNSVCSTCSAFWGQCRAARKWVGGGRNKSAFCGGPKCTEGRG